MERTETAIEAGRVGAIETLALGKEEGGSEGTESDAGADDDSPKRGILTS